MNTSTIAAINFYVRQLKSAIAIKNIRILRSDKHGKLANMILGAWVLGLATIPTPALACSCWHPQPEEYLQASALIFKGTVVSTEKVVPNTLANEYDIATLPEQYFSRRAKFRLTTSYKGPEVIEVDIEYRPSDGVNCGWGFTVGQEVTVFAGGNVRDGFGTGMCSMIPYASAIGNGDTRFQDAIEAYRNKRHSLCITRITTQRRLRLVVYSSLGPKT